MVGDAGDDAVRGVELAVGLRGGVDEGGFCDGGKADDFGGRLVGSGATGGGDGRFRKPNDVCRDVHEAGGGEAGSGADGVKPSEHGEGWVKA